MTEPNNGTKKSPNGCFWLLAIPLLLIVFAFVSCMSFGSRDDSPDSSQGEAEVTCEHLLKDRHGLKASGYTNEVETDEGDFTLYGRTQDGQKFICKIEGAMGDGNSTGTVEVSAE